MNDLHGQTALVTAAAGGAGRVIAKALSAAGAEVIACDIDVAALSELASEVPGIKTARCDAGIPEDIELLFKTKNIFKKSVDILVNNVGVSGPTAHPEEVSLEEWETTMRINLTSHFLFAKAVIPGMKARGCGAIVNISSGSAKVGLPMRLPYVVSKAAVSSMSLNLARELGPFGIRVNAILPGPIRGPRMERIISEKAKALGINRDDYEARLVQYTSLRCLMEPEDIANAVVFLASSGGARISGQLLGIDGNLEWEE
jgi:NAD(P)-dependent dehydrogenase (short-subunit alcohol dehydrogenase family)